MPVYYGINSVSILYKAIVCHYQPVRVADGLITARYTFIKNAGWEVHYPERLMCSVPKLLIKTATDVIFFFFFFCIIFQRKLNLTFHANCLPSIKGQVLFYVLKIIIKIIEYHLLQFCLAF